MVAFTQFILQITALTIISSLQSNYLKTILNHESQETPVLVTTERPASGTPSTLTFMKLASLASLRMTFKNEKNTLDNIDIDTNNEKGDDGKGIRFTPSGSSSRSREWRCQCRFSICSTSEFLPEQENCTPRYDSISHVQSLRTIPEMVSRHVY
ncbi:hypothetical protein R3P38DRAFT_2766529 [Favolaschia claudopus]|uniref:Secreted protein n=1 Tax=Favolaschia claudopus TaxID=2862362 RepID=A0AAW0D2P5_9AGAR